MLVMTTKLSKKKIIGAAFAILAVICVFCFYGNEAKTTMVFEKSGVIVEDVKMSEEGVRSELINKLGWEAEVSEFCEVQIPYEFDEVYKKYNEIQLSQGFDLEKYKGKRVMKYTYDIKNYPNESEVSLNMLVYKNKLIAGDVCSKKQGGFMHGLEKP